MVKLIWCLPVQRTTDINQQVVWGFTVGRKLLPKSDATVPFIRNEFSAIVSEIERKKKKSHSSIIVKRISVSPRAAPVRRQTKGQPSIIVSHLWAFVPGRVPPLHRTVLDRLQWTGAHQLGPALGPALGSALGSALASVSAG